MVHAASLIGKGPEFKLEVASHGTVWFSLQVDVKS